MNDGELLALYEDHMRRTAFVPGMDAELLPDVARQLDRGGREGEIMWHRFDDSRAAAVVERELAHFSGRSKRLNWKVYAGDRPASLPALLERSAFTVRTTDKLMILRPESLPPSTPSSTMELRVIDDPSRIDVLAAVWDSVWPGEGVWASIMAEELRRAPDRLRVLVAFDRMLPVASGYIILDPRKAFAYLGGGATVATHRGRGLYRSLLAERARIAAAFGTRHLVVEASPASAPILASQGFRELTTLRHYQRVFAPTPARA